MIQQYDPRQGYVDIDGQRYTIRAGVETISDYSAHADQKDLLNFVRRMRKKPHTVRIVHGDDDAKQTFKGQLLKERLAAVVAQSGQKVLLIDMDLRRGYMHKMFDMGPEDGVSDVLSRRIALQGAIKSTKVGELFVLPRGTIPPNPSDLLNEVKDQYDLVIVDTPPVMAVTDAAIVGRHCGVTMLVTRFGLNPAKEIELTKQRFEQNGINVKGGGT